MGKAYFPGYVLYCKNQGIYRYFHIEWMVIEWLCAPFEAMTRKLWPRKGLVTTLR
jgi:hypothetical protein